MSFRRNKKNKIKTLSSSLRKAPQSTSGSLTVEAALVFPITLFVLVFFLSFFRVLQVQQMTQEALNLAAEKAALEAEYPVGDSGDEGMVQSGGLSGNDPFLYGKALAYFQGELQQQSFPYRYIQGGILGFSYGDTRIKGEYVDLRTQYKISLPGGILNRASVLVEQRIRLKKWTGFHGEDEFGDGTYVFVTETGTVHHVSRECSHLKLSIQTMGLGSVMERYSPCHLCGEKVGFDRSYYVTTEGNRYHTSLSCSGLKRTVYMVKLEEVGGKPRCSRCGK